MSSLSTNETVDWDEVDRQILQGGQPLSSTAYLDSSLPLFDDPRMSSQYYSPPLLPTPPEKKRSQEIAAGNTDTAAKKQKTPYKCWVATLNNYTQQDIDRIVQLISSECEKAIVGQEVGDSGTPHLQMAFKFKKRVRMTWLQRRLSNRAHYEKMRGTLDEAFEYCKKEKVIYEWPIDPRVAILEQSYKNVQWKRWQKVVIDIFATSPDPRRVYWLWDAAGNTGKTFLAEFLALSRTAYYVCGSISNIAYFLKAEQEQSRPWRSGVVLDIPRSQDPQTVSYTGIEKLKGHMMFSTKYESGEIVKPRFHVVVFANFPPYLDKLSLDRWSVMEIKE